VFVSPRPYWVFYYDPEVSYFFDGVRVLRGRLPWHFEHPGALTHLLGAAIAWARGGLGFLDIDSFRVPAYCVGMILNLLGVYVLGRTFLAKSPPLLQLAAIWLYFASPAALDFTSVWAPETLFFFVGALLLATLSGFFDRAASWPRAIPLGICFGACVATKYTFLSWLPGLVLGLWIGCLPERRKSIAAVLGFLVGMSSGFLSATFFMRAQYGRSLQWLLQVLSRSGEYGSGEIGLPDARTMLGNLSSIVTSSKSMHAVWLVALLFLGWRLWHRCRSRDAERYGLAGVAVTCALSLTLPYVTGLREPALRYLLPAAVAGMGLVVLATRQSKWHARPVAQALTLLVAGVLLGRSLGVDLRAHEQRISTGRSLSENVERAVARASAGRLHPVVVYGWRLPEPSFALRIEALTKEEFDTIATRFPHSGHYDPWTHQVHLPKGNTRWDLVVLSRDDLSTFPERVGAVLEHLDGYQLLAAP
jgi:hypothetical protein